LPALYDTLHGRAAADQVQVRLSTADLLPVRPAGLGLFPAVLGAVALSAGLVALPGAAAGFNGDSRAAEPDENRKCAGDPGAAAAV